MLAAFPGCELGTIPPFGRIFGVPTVVEDALVEQRDIALATGDHRAAIRMLARDYVSLAQPRLGRFAIHESQFPVHPPLRTGAARTAH